VGGAQQRLQRVWVSCEPFGGVIGESAGCKLTTAGAASVAILIDPQTISSNPKISNRGLPSCEFRQLRMFATGWCWFWTAWPQI